MKSTTGVLALTAVTVILLTPSNVWPQDVVAPTYRSFYNCSWAKGDPGESARVHVAGCEDQEICSLYRGDEAHLELEFLARSDTPGIYRRIYGLFDKVLVPYGREVSVCNSTASVDDDVKCSQGGDKGGLRQGHIYRHTGTFLVKPFFPKVKLNVTVYLYDKKGGTRTPIACIQVPVQILDKE